LHRIGIDDDAVMARRQGQGQSRFAAGRGTGNDY
jgi:hypothetical protein